MFLLKTQTGVAELVLALLMINKKFLLFLLALSTNAKQDDEINETIEHIVGR